MGFARQRVVCAHGRANTIALKLFADPGNSYPEEDKG